MSLTRLQKTAIALGVIVVVLMITVGAVKARQASAPVNVDVTRYGM